MKKILSLLLGACTMFTACTDTETIDVPGGSNLSLNVQTAAIESRGLIESATLPDGHSIGLTLVDEGGTKYDNISYNNIKATASTGKTPQTWGLQSDILLSATQGTLYGYYPYNADVTDLSAVPVETTSQTDYMYATPVEGLNDGNAEAAVTMNHALAAIRLNIVRGTYSGTGAVTAVTVNGSNIATNGTLNALTGALTALTDTETDIIDNGTFTLSNGGQTKDIIFVPAGTSGTPSFKVTLDDKEYIATGAETTFQQGYVYKYTLTINNKEISLSDVNVDNWGYNESGNPVINAGYKVTIAGNTEGIAFSNKVNDDGSVTITAVPNYVLPALKVLAEAVCSTGATCTQIVNELGGRTITLSNITSDITLSFDNKLVYKNGVYAVSSTGSLIDYNSADASALGVALVAGEHKFMIAKADATNDGSNYNLYWGYNLYMKDVAGVVTNSKVDGTNDDGWLPKPDGTFYTTPHLSSDFSIWTAGALAEFNGAANTAAIIAGYTEHAVSMDARDMCTVLNTFNAFDSFKDWYVPACGQLALMYLNKTEINAALAKIGGTSLKDNAFYWSSSENYCDQAWAVNFYTGGVFYLGKDDRWTQVRFVRDYNEGDFGTIDLTTAPNGVYAVAKNGKGVAVADAHESCIAVALITDNQRIMIEKDGETNIDIKKAAHEADGATDDFYGHFYWGSYGTDVAGITDISSSDAAKQDFNGKANTAAIIATLDTDSYTTYANMGTYCTKFNEMNGIYNDWYIPAAGQLYEIYINRNNISIALNNIGGNHFITGMDGFWSSSEESSDNAWYVAFFTDDVREKRKAENRGGLPVRFVRDIN